MNYIAKLEKKKFEFKVASDCIDIEGKHSTQCNLSSCDKCPNIMTVTMRMDDFLKLCKKCGIVMKVAE